MTLLKVQKQMPKPNYIEGAQMLLREQKDERFPDRGIWCCLKNHNKGLKGKGFCNRYVCVFVFVENLIKNVLLIFKNVFCINLGGIFFFSYIINKITMRLKMEKC